MRRRRKNVCGPDAPLVGGGQHFLGRGVVEKDSTIGNIGAIRKEQTQGKKKGGGIEHLLPT